MNEVRIGNITVGKNNPIFVIAEAGVNHNGSLETAKKLVDAAKEAGADAVKFQSFTTENLVTAYAPKADYQKETTSEKESQFEMLKKLELKAKIFFELKEYCDKKGILFLSTPHTADTLEYLDKLMPAYKIGSGDLTNIPVLEEIAKRQRPIILGTGMATLAEVHETVDAIKKINNQLIILHCTTEYPCRREDVNLRAMQTLQKEFDYPVGYSDHTEGIDVSLMAARLGAVVIEKHFTLDKNMEGPDHKASLNPEELKELVTGLRNKNYPELDEVVLGSSEKKPTETELMNAKVARKSIVANQDIAEGAIISRDMLSIKRPGIGIKPSELGNILGKRAALGIKKDELIKSSQIKKKILITGGAGFIGSSLIKELGDYDIVSLDISNDIIRGTLNAEFVDGNILEESVLNRAMKNVDIVIHLAGIKGESNCLKSPALAILSNVLATALVVKHAKLNNVSKIIFASSIYTYSSYKKRTLPLKESDEAEPDTLYGSLKLCCEEIIRNSGIDYVILRFANVYGAGSKIHKQIGGAIGNFIDAVINNSEINIINSGENKIDYVNVADVADAIKAAFEADISGQIYNIGGNSPLSVIELARLVIGIAKDNGIDYSKEFIEKQTEEKILADSWSDISRANRELGWSPKISLKEGINEIIDFRMGLK